MKTKTRILSMLLAVCLLAGLIQLPAISVFAADTESLQIMSVMSKNVLADLYANGYKIHFGSQGTKKPWGPNGLKIIGYDGSGVAGANELTLISDAFLATDVVYYDNTKFTVEELGEGTACNTYEGSNLQTTLGTIANTYLSEQERAVLVERAGTLVWPLSKEEAEMLSADLLKVTGQKDRYYLRTLGSNGQRVWTVYANTGILSDAGIYYNGASVPHDVSPALSINLDDIVLVRSRDSSESAYKAATRLHSVTAYTGTDGVRLTVYDERFQNFKVTGVYADASQGAYNMNGGLPKAYISYEGADLKSAHITAVIMDSNKNVVAHGVGDTGTSGYCIVDFYNFRSDAEVKAGLNDGTMKMYLINETHSTATMTDYSSQLQYVPLNPNVSDEPEEPAGPFEFYKTNVNLGSNLTLFFAFEQSKIDAANVSDYSAKITGTVNGTVSGSDFISETIDGIDCFVVPVEGLAAKQMSDEITVTIYKGDEAVSETRTSSIREYAETVLNGDFANNFKATAAAMLQYGAEAQEYFGYNSSDLADKNLTPDHLALISGITVDTSKEISLTTGKDLFMGTRVHFESEIAMEFAAEKTANAVRGEFSFTDHNGSSKTAAATVRDAGNADAFYFSGMVVADLNQDVTLKLYDAQDNVVVEVVDSISAYLGRVQDEDAQDLCEAFGKFSTAAYAYFHP